MLTLVCHVLRNENGPRKDTLLPLCHQRHFSCCRKCRACCAERTATIGVSSDWIIREMERDGVGRRQFLINSTQIERRYYEARWVCFSYFIDCRSNNPRLRETTDKPTPRNHRCLPRPSSSTLALFQVFLVNTSFELDPFRNSSTSAGIADDRQR